MATPSIGVLTIATAAVLMLAWTSWTIAVREETRKGVAGALMTAGLALYLATDVFETGVAVELLGIAVGTASAIGGAVLLLRATSTSTSSSTPEDDERAGDRD